MHLTINCFICTFHILSGCIITSYVLLYTKPHVLSVLLTCILRNNLQFYKYCLYRLARMDQALKEMDNDGLNSLRYSVEVTEHPLFTLIRANLENAL